MSDEPSFRLPAPKEYLIALGAFALNFNRSEQVLWAIFRAYLPHQEARNYLFDELHNRARVDLIKCFVQDDDDQEFADAALHGLKCFDICCENRNIVLHAFPSPRQDDRGLALLKRTKDRPGLLSVYIAPLAEIEAAADSTDQTHLFLLDLANWLDDRAKGKMRPLPERPPLPSKLSLLRPSRVRGDG